MRRFSELALLLPYHDVTLVMVGPSVAKLMEAAVAEGVDDSPLRRSVESNTPIFKYHAPEELGSGSIQVVLHPFATWDQAELVPTTRSPVVAACSRGAACHAQRRIRRARARKWMRTIVAKGAYCENKT